MILVCLVGIISTEPLSVHAENKKVEETNASLEADISNKVFDIGLSNGSGIFKKDTEKRKEINNRILGGTETQELSLYDRFGGNISFVPYFGEKKYSLSLIDTFYDSAKQNDSEFSFNLDQLFENRAAQINNEVYENRPEILNESDISTGKVDPRRATYGIFSSSGGDAALGNFYLALSRMVTDFVGFMTGQGLYDIVEDAWSTIVDSGLYTSISSILVRYLPFFVAIFVIGLISSIYNIMTKGDKSFKEVLSKTLNFALALGLTFTLMSNPNLFKTVTSFSVRAIDNLFAMSLNQSANEVSASDDISNVVESTLWSKSVLEPWAKGMFDGRTYEELYTQFSDEQEDKKMPQSNDDIMTSWNDGSIKYSSATLTGDIEVPIGNDKSVKNWAALAWSTQSIYHIDAIRNNNKLVDGYSWPIAIRTPNNPNIYIDNFRWLDAKLNISPGYSSTDKNDNNYLDANTYTYGFTLNGIDSLFRSILLLPIVYPIIRRLYCLMQIVAIAFRWLIRSFAAMLKPNDSEYTLINNFKAIWKPLYIYFWWSLVTFILITFYVLLVGSVLGNLIWILSAFVICKFKPVTSNKQMRELKASAIKRLNSMKKKIKNLSYSK